MYPASLTKIMTAIVAIENTDDMDEETTVPSDIFLLCMRRTLLWQGLRRARW